MSKAPWKKSGAGYEIKYSDLEPHFNEGRIPLPDAGTVAFINFKRRNGSGLDTLYWQYKRVGPGVHTTTYTIRN
jgi:hypothetical protein